MPSEFHARHRGRSRDGRTRFAELVTISGIALTCLLVARKADRLGAQDADPTFANDVAPIVYKNCSGCHRAGGLAPFSLTEYDSAKKWVDDIHDAVASGYMPPWHADGPRGTFRNDRRLSEYDRQTLLRWTESGAKSGDLSQLPPKPVFPSSWSIGTPDAIVSMPEDYTVPASGTIEYQYFEVPTNFAEDKWIQAMEFMPGAREVVHHVLVYAKVPAAPGATPAAPRPANTPAPKPDFIRDASGSTPARPTRQDLAHAPPRQLGSLIGGTAPGTNVMEFAPGTALKIRAGTVLTFQMHYTAKGHEMHDRSRVGFRFASAPPDEEIFSNQFINGSFTIPAGAKDVAVPATLGVNEPVRIWGLLPHTHLRGVRWQYKLERPDGTSEIILDVPRYDFNWQTYYLFDKPLEVPVGGRIVSTAWYDNSTMNRSNPDATKDVKWGDQTWEEMQYTAFLYSFPGRKNKPAGGQ